MSVPEIVARPMVFLTAFRFRLISLRVISNGDVYDAFAVGAASL